MPPGPEVVRLLRLLDDFNDVRMFREPRHVGMGFERAQAPRECAVLPCGEVLIAEEDDEVFVQRVANCLEGLVGQGKGEVHAMDLRAKRAGDRLNPEGSVNHRRLLLSELAGLGALRAPAILRPAPPGDNGEITPTAGFPQKRRCVAETATHRTKNSNSPAHPAGLRFL